MSVSFTRARRHCSPKTSPSVANDGKRVGGLKDPLYQTVSALASTQVRKAFHRDGWVFEEKVDGWRILATKTARASAWSPATAATTRDASPPSWRRSPSSPRAPWCPTARWRSTTSSCDHASSGCENQTQTRWPRRPCSWRSICSTRTGASSPGGRCTTAALDLESVVAGSEFVPPVRRLAGNGFEAWAEVMARDAAGSVGCAHEDVPGHILHDFRRMAVRNLQRAGVPRSVAMKMVGHKTESVYRRYAIVDKAMLRDAAIKLAERRGQSPGQMGYRSPSPCRGRMRENWSAGTGLNRRHQDFQIYPSESIMARKYSVFPLSCCGHRLSI